jgi:hypothetical protein
VYHNTTQTVGTGSATALAFNAENSDLRGWHTTGGSNSRITVSATGYYQASVYLLYAGTGSDDSHYRDNIEFRINGTAFAIDRRIQIKDAFDKIFSVSAPIVPMAASDYIEVYLEQNSGGTRTVAANPIFSLWRIA